MVLHIGIANEMQIHSSVLLISRLAKMPQTQKAKQPWLPSPPFDTRREIKTESFIYWRGTMWAQENVAGKSQIAQQVYKINHKNIIGKTGEILSLQILFILHKSADHEKICGKIGDFC